MDETTAIEQAYTLRSLEAKDVFIVSQILKNIGINEFKSIFQAEILKEFLSGEKAEMENLLTGEKEEKIEKEDKKNKASQVGMAIMFDIAGIVLKNLPSCEKPIYTFLASLSGMKEKEIEALPLVTFTEMVVEVFQKEEFRDFIRVVSKLFK